MLNIVLITNPISGNGSSIKAAQIAQQALASKHINVHIAYTEYTGHASELATSCLPNFDIIVAIGGDGTVNEIAQALVGTNKILGIIPSGSGNGLARHLGIPMSLKSAIKTIYRKNIKSIDAPKINNEYFFCTAGIGFDAKVSHTFSKFEGRGLKNYIKAILMEFRNYTPKRYTITINGEEISSKAFVITIANAAQYGNEAYIAPTAKINDGLLEVTILPKPSFLTGLNFGIRLFLRNIHKHPKVLHLQSDEIKIKTNLESEKIFGHKDGEPEEWVTPLNFKIKKNEKLNVIVRKNNI